MPEGVLSNPGDLLNCGLSRGFGGGWVDEGQGGHAEGGPLVAFWRMSLLEPLVALLSTGSWGSCWQPSKRKTRSESLHRLGESGVRYILASQSRFIRRLTGFDSVRRMHPMRQDTMELSDELRRRIRESLQRATETSR